MALIVLDDVSQLGAHKENARGCDFRPSDLELELLGCLVIAAEAGQHCLRNDLLVLVPFSKALSPIVIFNSFNSIHNHHSKHQEIFQNGQGW
jgi:hypothetical protein